MLLEPHTFILLLFTLPFFLMLIFKKRAVGRFTLRKAAIIALLGLAFFALDLALHNVPALQGTLHALEHHH